jgi:hypothetical protein
MFARTMLSGTVALVVSCLLAFVAFRQNRPLHAAGRPEAGQVLAIDGGVTPPLRDSLRRSSNVESAVIVPRENPLHLLSGVFADPQLQLNFAGIGVGDIGFVPALPPDANGAVGATQYVQGVNNGFAVFDKTTGALVFGPATTDVLFTQLPQCAANRMRAPLVYYDRGADRWIILQSGHLTNPFPGVLQCLAISQTPDATGPYRNVSYGFFSQDVTWSPARLGVWPDAYYMTIDPFVTSPPFPEGVRVCAFDRIVLLAGGLPMPSCHALDVGVPEILPSDLDGAHPPPAGSPNYLLALGKDSLRLWKFGPLVGGNAPLSAPTSIPVDPFLAACGTGGSCIPQPGTGQTLDSVGNRLMPRLAYRNFGDHESLVVNHSVDAGGGVTGVRWYEIRSPGTTPVAFQQGTHSPTSHHRWMGSIAMDRAGNMALGYSVSSGSLSPEIRYTGRFASDAPGTLLGESTLQAGAGSQLGDSAWGAISSMALDPVDDCTFFYTNEYLKSSGSLAWSTRIGTFRFPSCGASDFYTLTPCRLADTRGAAGPSGGPALAAGATRSFPVAGLCSIPPDASSIALNVTAIQPASMGYLTLFSGDAPLPPLVSTLNFSVGQTRGSNAIVALPLGGAGTLQVRNRSGGAVHLVLDVSGYFK